MGAYGSLAENQRYFRLSGIGTGAHTIFVGTLPTIPLCECSIALGCMAEDIFSNCSAEALTDEIDSFWNSRMLRRCC